MVNYMYVQLKLLIVKAHGKLRLHAIPGRYSLPNYSRKFTLIEHAGTNGLKLDTCK